MDDTCKVICVWIVVVFINCVIWYRIGVSHGIEQGQMDTIQKIGHYEGPASTGGTWIRPLEESDGSVDTRDGGVSIVFGVGPVESQTKLAEDNEQ